METLKIRDIYIHQLGAYLYKYHNKLLPHDQHAISFTSVTDRHSYTYNTRQSSHVYVAPTNTLLAKNTIKIHGAIFWNLLKSSIKNSPSLSSFKKNLKYHIIQQYVNDVSNNDYASIT